MLNVTVAGNLGADAEYKQTQGGAELCRFSVAADVGYGDNKQTYWVDVTRWGKGARGLADILRKGSKVTVTGELTTREHNGKTYLQCRADHVAIQGTPHGSNIERYGGSGGPPDMGGSNYDDLSDDVPFVTANGFF